MNDEKFQYCPLFPDVICPRGMEAVKACEVRVNGNFDPVMYFKDQLVLHCALHRSQPEAKKATR